MKILELISKMPELPTPLSGGSIHFEILFMAAF